MHPWLIQSPPISTYGVCIVAAVVAAWMWARKRARAAGIDSSFIDLMVPLLMVAGLLGAWLFGRLTDAFTDEAAHSLVLVGVLVVATAAGIGYALISRIPLGVLGDICAAPVALAIAVGRLGCFFAGCCYGKICPIPWLGIRFPAGSFAYLDQLAHGELPPGATSSLPVYPTQLAEAGLCVLLSFFIWHGMSRRGISGEKFLQLGIGYSAIRFAVEFFRADNPPVLQGMTFSQVAALLIAGVAMATWILRRRYAERLGLQTETAVSSLPA